MKVIFVYEKKITVKCIFDKSSFCSAFSENALSFHGFMKHNKLLYIQRKSNMNIDIKCTVQC